MTSSSPGSTPIGPAGSSAGRLRWICLLLALVTASCGSWLALQQIDQPLTGIDDANIFFTYASNLAGGEGFVYNAGGERVEGFTSLLWTLICACAFLVSAQPEPLLLAVSTVLLATALYQASYFLAESITKPGNETRPDWLTLTMLLALAAWALATPRFMVWTTVTLMDTGLWCMVFTCGTIAFARAARRQDSCWQNDRCLVGWTVAMLLTRPEAMLIVLVWIGSLALVRLCSTSGAEGNLVSRLWSHCRLPLLGYLVTLGTLTLFRLVYFGYPLPNTYYAKVSPSLLYNLKLGGGYFLAFVGSQLFVVLALVGLRGFRGKWGIRWAAIFTAYFLLTWWLLTHHLPRFWVPVLPFVVLALVIVAWSGIQALLRTLRRRPQVNPGQGVLVAALLCALGIPVITGGDHFNLFRFFQPCWLLLALPLLIGAGCQIRQSRLLRANALPVVAALAGSAMLFYSIQYPRWNELGDDIQVEFKIAAKGRQRGELLNRMFAGEDVSIGVGTAGGIGLTYQGEVIDLLGLNNLAMGHSPGDRKGGKNHAAFNQDVFFEQLPDIVRPTLIQPHQPVPQDLEQFLPPAGGFWDTALDGMERSSDRFHQLYRPIVIECPGEQLQLRAWCRPHVVDLLREKGARYQDLSPKQPY